MRGDRGKVCLRGKVRGAGRRRRRRRHRHFPGERWSSQRFLCFPPTLCFCSTSPNPDPNPPGGLRRNMPRAFLVKKASVSPGKRNWSELPDNERGDVYIPGESHRGDEPCFILFIVLELRNCGFFSRTCVVLSVWSQAGEHQCGGSGEGGV